MRLILSNLWAFDPRAQDSHAQTLMFSLTTLWQPNRLQRVHELRVSTEGHCGGIWLIVQSTIRIFGRVFRSESPKRSTRPKIRQKVDPCRNAGKRWAWQSRSIGAEQGYNTEDPRLALSCRSCRAAKSDMIVVPKKKKKSPMKEKFQYFQLRAWWDLTKETGWT